MSSVALEVMAIPTSSALSERPLSVVNRLLTANQNCLGAYIVPDMTLVKLNFTDFAFEDFVTTMDGLIFFVNQ